MKLHPITGCVAILLLVSVATPVQAQKLALESTYEITKSAKKGYLDEVTYDPKTQMTQLSFVTRNKANGKKSTVNYQNYFFDKDYKFVKVEEETDVTYRNKKYRDDEYSVEGISMQNNLVGTFVLKKKLTTYTWNWFFGGYNRKVKLLEKIKPKDEMGNKYTLRQRWEGDEKVLAMVQTKGKTADPNEYIFMLIDKDLNMQVTDAAKFDSPQATVAFTYIPMATTEDEGSEDDDGGDEGAEEGDGGDDEQGTLDDSDIAIIFAASSMGKKANADEHSYTYWRVSQKGIITEKIPFRAEASVWKINQAVYASGDVYLMGPANEGKYYDQAKKDDGVKWKLFQLGKISNQKVTYITTTNLDEFDAKLKTPPSQKKSPSYDGKRLYTKFADALADGSILIAGQNYEYVTQNKTRRRSYRDPIMFHFDNAGHLKSQYGIRREENQKSATYAAAPQFGNRGAGCYYWTIFEMDGFREEKEGNRKVTKILYYPSVARIDAASGNIGDFVQFGLVNEKPKYYLHNNFPILRMPESNSIVYLGVDKPGKVLWFGKVVLE